MPVLVLPSFVALAMSHDDRLLLQSEARGEWTVMDNSTAPYTPSGCGELDSQFHLAKGAF